MTTQRMNNIGYRRYKIDAPTPTKEALRNKFYPDTDHFENAESDGQLVLIAPINQNAAKNVASNPTDPVATFLEAQQLDHEIIGSRPVHHPRELTTELRETLTVEDLMGTTTLANYVEQALDGDDPRQHSVHGKIRFGVGAASDGSPQPDPITPETIRSMRNDNIIDDQTDAPYPSASQVLEWNTELQQAFDDVQLCGIGFFMPPLPNWPEGVVMLDGVGVTTTNNSQLPQPVIEWLRDRFYGYYDVDDDDWVVPKEDYLNMPRASEFHTRKQKTWLRIWWS